MQDSSISQNLLPDNFKRLILCETACQARFAGWLILQLGTTLPSCDVLQGLPAGVGGFRLPVVSSDTVWKHHQQCWEFWPDPGCQLSVALQPHGSELAAKGYQIACIAEQEPVLDA